MKKYPYVLFVFLCLVFIVAGIEPVSRSVWVAEAIPVALTMAGFAICYRHFRFSNWAYTLMAFWLVLHTIGSHYTFAEVPFDWFNELIGSERNHFDRVGHYSIGFYAYPMAEYLVRKKYAGKVLSGIVGLFFVMALAAAYEMIEWQYAVIVGGENANDFLGSQGDIWDAQKDMWCDTCGALTALVIFYFTKPWRRGEEK